MTGKETPAGWARLGGATRAAGRLGSVADRGLDRQGGVTAIGLLLRFGNGDFFRLSQARHDELSGRDDQRSSDERTMM